MNFLYLSNVIKRAQFSCKGVISALHHVPLFMDKSWFILMPVETVLDPQLLQTRCVVIQLAMNRSRLASVLLNLMAFHPN